MDIMKRSPSLDKKHLFCTSQGVLICVGGKCISLPSTPRLVKTSLISFVSPSSLFSYSFFAFSRVKAAQMETRQERLEGWRAAYSSSMESENEKDIRQ